MDKSKPFHGLPWWSQPKGPQSREAIIAAWKSIDIAEGTRLRGRMQRSLELYLGRKVDLQQWSQSSHTAESSRRENVARAAIGSACAKISTNRPRPFFLTVEGTLELRRQAKQKMLFVEGVMRSEHAYALSRQVFRDACLFPLGIIKVTPDAKRKKVRMERVLRHMLAIDPTDAHDKDPRSLFQHMVMPEASVIAKWGKKVATTAAGMLEGMSADYTIQSPVSVIEAWHLPSGPDEKDGRHVICTNAGDPLVDEPWKRERFPFAWWTWGDPLTGVDGEPMMEELAPYQDDLDEINDMIRSWVQSARKRCWVQIGTAVTDEELEAKGLDAGDPATGYYKGVKPEFSNDPGPPIHLYEERRHIKAEAFEQVGLSLLLATSQTPKNLESGVAQQEYKDTESARFLDVGQSWEEFFCDPTKGIAGLIEDAADDLQEMGIDIEAVGKDDGRFRRIKWSSLKNSRDKFEIDVRPASIFPREVAGRLERIQTLGQMMPGSQALLMTMIDDPDVEEATAITAAPVKAVLYDLQRIENGENITPEPFLDLELAKSLALHHYLRAQTYGCDDSVGEAYRNYLMSIEDMLQEAMAAQAAMMAPPGAPMPQDSLQAPPGAGPVPPAGPAPLPQNLPIPPVF